MPWVGEVKEFARALRVEAGLLLHEELQRQTLRASARISKTELKLAL